MVVSLRGSMIVITANEILPYQGILACQFGMTIAQIHAILGSPDSSFKKVPTSECPTDAYDRDHQIRIISVRTATRQEQRNYES